MKKTLFVLAVAAVMVFAMAASALAYSPVIGTGGLQYGGAGKPATAPLNSSTAYVYLQWSAVNVLGNTNGTDVSPHGNYTTTTAKCIVCHSVHDAAAGVNNGGTTTAGDTLLRMKASQACGFCHVYTGGVVNGTPVYDGLYLPSAHDGINVSGVTVAGANPGHYSSPDCGECHTSVHGMGADASVPAAIGFLLKTQGMLADSGNRFTNPAQTRTILGSLNIIKAQNGGTDNPYTGWTVAQWTAGSAGAAGTETDQRKQVMGIFCAECHVGAYATNSSNAATNVHNAGSAFSGPMSGHRVGANITATNNWNAGSSSAKVNTGLTVAFAGATTCWSCHDAPDAFNNASFPHSFGGSNFGLLSAANETAAKSTLAENGTGVGTTADMDGVCLKCHVSSNGTSGVGISF